MAGMGRSGVIAMAALVLAGAFLPGTIVPAGAQPPTQAQASAIRQACRSDYPSHCAGVPTGGSAALSCLQRNAADLSSGCQQALGAVGATGTAHPAPALTPTPIPGPKPAGPPMSPRQEAAVLRHACGADYRTYCSEIRPGGGRAIACLREIGPALSPTCQRALMATHAR